ncbi:heme ABC transporter ATP-binding protein [Pseudohalocynthiibacter aestuariivivens]|uniref:Heme ABC transporter ATP-binding protein n=1 Tax=Roseovarius pelagicus TaxID=2980108 RepID=A0ABY6D8C6_9RHOB|nr:MULTISPECIES: heme ABC transporter ATP-binding protein [Rhodobacterales]QIE45695.1 heme ABC transporter ATP-binding protein [Pseudohalocynthiibacter aestuariivivens]UXX82386.1 heme ABC transporter ATP-binding protein [Roseovarius pelagicus]
MTMIARDITFTIGGKTILRDVNFTARPGQVTAIVGPNGSGKSTLLRIMSGEESARGTVTLNGLNVIARNARDLARTRGVLQQATNMAFPFTVIEVLRIGLQAGPYALRPSVPEEALAAVGLADYASRYYHELSGGEQQRTQLARVLCQVWEPVLNGTPSWLLLDEPVASLDIGHQLVIMELARRYADAGGGVVTVMHDLNLTALYADRMALMQDGCIAAEGVPREVLTDEILSKAYGCHLRVNAPPPPGWPYILPHMAQLTH